MSRKKDNIAGVGAISDAIAKTADRRETEKTGLQKRLEVEPDYRPHCLNCSTMRRVTLKRKDGRRIMECEIVAEDGPSAEMLKKLGIMPRVGCGIQWDIDTQEILSEGVGSGVYPR